MKIIFLDIDGVLNCELYYKETPPELRRETYPLSEMCKERISWLNELCKNTGAKIVISSTWRIGRELEELQNLFIQVGATFEIIGKTPHMRDRGCVRGNEIHRWILDNSEKIIGLPYYDFKDYAIIDDDSDMLLWQQKHFFQTDNYSGLTPNIVYNIGRFFGQPIFQNMLNAEQKTQGSDTTDDDSNSKDGNKKL